VISNFDGGGEVEPAASGDYLKADQQGKCSGSEGFCKVLPQLSGSDAKDGKYVIPAAEFGQGIEDAMLLVMWRKRPVMVRHELVFTPGRTVQEQEAEQDGNFVCARCLRDAVMNMPASHAEVPMEAGSKAFAWECPDHEADGVLKPSRPAQEVRSLRWRPPTFKRSDLRAGNGVFVAPCYSGRERV
jgi:hypothetical protein